MEFRVIGAEAGVGGSACRGEAGVGGIFCTRLSKVVFGSFHSGGGSG